MTERKRRYWAMRTDEKHNRELLWRELQAGRLRQGWGYHPSQDLRTVVAAAEAGQPLTPEQEATRRHWKMLTTREGGIKPGDWILVPNLPEPGKFVIVEVTGDYYYDPITLSEKEDVNGLHQDYGHVLPVKLLTPNGVHKYAEDVDASLRRTFRSLSRLWNLDKYADAIEKIVEAYMAGKPLGEPVDAKDRMKDAVEKAIETIREPLEEELLNNFNKRFSAAEWEEVIAKALENLYPGSVVKPTGGPNEQGADIVLEIPNWFDPQGGPWKVLVQVKNYEGEMGPEAIEQLEQAFHAYSKEGSREPVLLLAVFTTAEKASKEAQGAATALEQKLGVPVRIVLRKDLKGLLAKGLVLQDWEVGA